MLSSFPEEYIEETDTLIQRKARQFAGLADRDDLQQEFWLTAVNRFHRFDPQRGELGPYLAKVIENKALSMARARDCAALQSAPIDAPLTAARASRVASIRVQAQAAISQRRNIAPRIWD